VLTLNNQLNDRNAFFFLKSFNREFLHAVTVSRFSDNLYMELTACSSSVVVLNACPTLAHIFTEFMGPV
jgi:hypothetical protein